jgi:DNA primase large subunit
MSSQINDTRSTDLRDSPMMAHLLDALQAGEDIGHFGRLAFVMIARHFLSEDELIHLLAGQPGMDENGVRAMILQVQERDYNPPKRSTILEWQAQQDFPICPDPDDPRACNVYRELRFPEEIYERIGEFWEERASEG